MMLFYESGRQIRGDAIIAATLRSDLSPIPMTLEAELITDSGTSPLLEHGKEITTGSGLVFEIVKREAVKRSAVKGGRLVEGVRITALFKPCISLAFVRSSAVVKEGATLSGIFQACGATVRGIEADFAVPRFSCLVGQTPSFAIRQALQEQGGSVRWKSGKLQFSRYEDLKKQKPVAAITGLEAVDTMSGMLERHTIPNYYSTDETGAVIHGQRLKARVAKYIPSTPLAALNSMTKVLVQRMAVKVPYDARLCAGDAVSHISLGPLVVVTGVHEFKTDSDGAPDQYTRLFLASLE